MKLLYPATRDEWLALRKKYVSSTESSALFGQNPYMTAFEMAVGKKSDIIDECSLGERPKWGVRLQDAIAQGVADDYGVKIEPMGLTYAVDDASRMGSSFDYQIIGSENLHPDLSGTQLIDMFQRLGPGLLEVKNVDSLEYRNKWVDDEAPEHIEIQLQHQLEVLGLPWGAIAALVGGNRVGLIVRERDKKVGGIIRRRIESFWIRFEAGILPDPLMPDDASVIIALYQYADPNKVYDGADEKNKESIKKLQEQVFLYKSISSTIKEMEDSKEVTKARILEIIKDAEKALIPPFEVIGLKGPETIQGFTVSAAMRGPVDIAAYTRSGYRDFRITPKKEAKK
jgi:predicted phage-related endonuclease